MNNNQIENLLQIAAQRLGTTPENLKAAAESGQLQNAVDTKGNEKLKEILSNPEEARKLLSTPQAQKLMKMFSES